MTNNSKCCVIFDGDDTLWETESLYDKARQEVRDFVDTVTHEGETWERLQRKLDVENVKLYGFKKERFPLSCVQAYDSLLKNKENMQEDGIRGKIISMANSVFNTKATVKDDVWSTFEELSKMNILIVLLTKGEKSVQRMRIEQSGLEHFFTQTNIVDEKTPKVFERIINELGLDIEKVWMVGNSLTSDINPALSSGIENAVWIDTHVWEYEKSLESFVDHRVIAKSKVSEIINLLKEKGC